MRYFFTVVFLSIFLTSCSTTSTNVTSGNIKIGMNKADFCVAAVSFRPGEDPCHAPVFTTSKEAPGIYYPSTKMEIMHSHKKDYFFVFQNVNTPYNYVSYKQGDGTLIKIFKNFNDAKEFASGDVKFSIETSKIDRAKKICSDRGLTEGTEKFADCALAELKKITE